MTQKEQNILTNLWLSMDKAIGYAENHDNYDGFDDPEVATNFQNHAYQWIGTLANLLKHPVEKDHSKKVYNYKNHIWDGLTKHDGVLHVGTKYHGVACDSMVGETKNKQEAVHLADKLNDMAKNHRIDDNGYGHGFYTPIQFPSVHNLKEAEQSINDTLTPLPHKSIFKNK